MFFNHDSLLETARGGAEAAVGLYYKTFSPLKLARIVGQPGPCVRALCEPVLSKNMTCAWPRCNATLSDTLRSKVHTSHPTFHTSHIFTHLHNFTLHAPHFTLHTSSHLISPHQGSTHLFADVR